MKVIFTPGPAAQTASFGAFDGVKRHCIKYKTAKGGVKRCETFKEGKGHPTNRGVKCENMRSTGNSSIPMLRVSKVGCGAAAPKKTKKSAKRTPKKTKKSPRK